MDKMIDKFREKVEDFVRIYCHEYMSDVSVEYDFSDGNSALVKMEETCGRKWEVPIRETFRNEHGVDIGIDIGDAGYLVDNAGGLYCYLWYKATKKTTAADVRIVELEKENKRLRDEKQPFGEHP